MSAHSSGAPTRVLMHRHASPVALPAPRPLALVHAAAARAHATIVRVRPTRSPVRESDRSMTTAALKRDHELESRLADWLARCALGDRKAFRQLYDATAPRLLGVVAQLVGRGALAEDLLQDVYVRIWKAAGQYRAGAGS